LASKEVRFNGSSVVQAVGERVLLKSSGAAMGLSSEAAIEGSRVLLNSHGAGERSGRRDLE